MAPDSMHAEVKRLCELYGARFHNTGYMGAFWAELLPALMRSSDLPFTLEPGGPAGDLAGFKKQIGLYATEAIQAIHYFIHIRITSYNVCYTKLLRASIACQIASRDSSLARKPVMPT